MVETRKSEFSRRRILEAAEAVFSRRGYDGARIDEIAREAGCNKALIYYYFKGKRAILDELVDEFFRESTSRLADYVAAGGLLEKAPIAESRAFKPMFDFLNRRRDLLRVLIMESIKDDEITPHVFKFVDVPPDQEAKLLDALRASGLKPDPDIEYSQFLEFFTGVIPTILFVVLAEAWGRHFGIDHKRMEAMFLAAYDETHMQHHRNK